MVNSTLHPMEVNCALLFEDLPEGNVELSFCLVSECFHMVKLSLICSSHEICARPTLPIKQVYPRWKGSKTTDSADEGMHVSVYRMIDFVEIYLDSLCAKTY
jgi:hypothetical protein